MTKNEAMFSRLMPGISSVKANIRKVRLLCLKGVSREKIISHLCMAWVM